MKGEIKKLGNAKIFSNAKIVGMATRNDSKWNR
jgi:hypothetical protein